MGAQNLASNQMGAKYVYPSSYVGPQYLASNPMGAMEPWQGYYAGVPKAARLNNLGWSMFDGDSVSLIGAQNLRQRPAPQNLGWSMFDGDSVSLVGAQNLAAQCQHWQGDPMCIKAQQLGWSMFDGDSVSLVG